MTQIIGDLVEILQLAFRCWMGMAELIPVIPSELAEALPQEVVHW